MNEDAGMRSLALFAWALLLSACSNPTQRYAKSFVHWDAVSDATSSAEERCGGSAYLIEGRRGYSPDDYSCEPKQERKVIKAGGTHMMFVPQSNGSVSAVPVSTGSPMERVSVANAQNSPCGSPDPNWPTKSHTAEPVIDVIFVKASGTISYNGDVVDLDYLTSLLRQKSEMSTSPAVLIRHNAGATCSNVNAIRNLMRRTLDCASGKCAEGPTWDWVPDRGFNGFDGGR